MEKMGSCPRSPKLRSQISRRADDSFPVFARPVLHAGHEIGIPSMTDFDVCLALYHDIHQKHITHASAFT